MDLLVLIAFLVVSLLEIGIPIGLLFFLSKKFNLNKRVFLFGAVFFIAIQILHVPVVLATQTPLAQFLKASGFEQIAIIAILSAYLGLLAGLFEEVARYFLFKKFFPLKKIKKSKNNAVLFGAGWGGVESIIVGLLVLLTGFAYLNAAPLTQKQVSDWNSFSGGTLSEQEVHSTQTQIRALMNVNAFDVFLGLMERIMTISLHVVWSLMVLIAVVEKKRVLLGIAVLWHALVDALAVFVASGFQSVLGAELVVFVFFLAGLYYLKKNWPFFQKAFF